MSLTPVQQTDPFELPVAFRGRLMTYQWGAPTICGDPNPDYDKLLESGWVAVPAQWLKGWYKGSQRFVTVKTNVLLCHAYPRDEEAERIAGAQRNVEDWMARMGAAGFSGGVRIQHQDQSRAQPVKRVTVGDPAVAGLIAQREADRFRSALEEKEKELQGLHEKLLASATAHAAALARPEPKPRHRLLKWLFDLISTEKSP